MAATKCEHPRFKRDLRWIEEWKTSNSRKIHKSSDVQSPLTDQSIFVPRQGKHIETGKTETASNSKCQTSSQQQRSQEQLWEFYGSRKYKNLKEMFNFEESDDSEEEEEKEGQKGITEKECNDDREGYELTIKAFDAMFGKPVA